MRYLNSMYDLVSHLPKTMHGWAYMVAGALVVLSLSLKNIVFGGQSYFMVASLFAVGGFILQRKTVTPDTAFGCIFILIAGAWTQLTF